MGECKKVTVYIDDAIRDLAIPVEFVLFKDLNVEKSCSTIQELQNDIGKQLLSVLTNDAIKNNKILQGYKDLRALIGLSRQKYPASPEALLKLLLKNGSLPQINCLVDIYNSLSVESGFSMGAHDLDYISGNSLSFKLTDGCERFLPMGAIKPCPVQKGEYGYIDGSNEILCRLEYRQCQKTRITLKTTSCIVIIQGNRNTDRLQMTSIRNKLIRLIKQFYGGDHELLPLAA